MKALTAAQVAALTTADVAVLSTDQIQALGTSDITALSTAQAKALSTDDIAALTTAQAKALTTADVAALSTDQVTALTTADLAAFTTADLAAFTTAQVVALNTADIAALSISQISVLSTSDVAVLTTAQVAALSTASRRGGARGRGAGGSRLLGEVLTRGRRPGPAGWVCHMGDVARLDAKAAWRERTPCPNPLTSRQPISIVHTEAQTRHAMARLIRNLLDGAKTILNLFPSDELQYKIPKRRSDAEALRSDWEKIGGDMRKAMGRVGSKTKRAHR